MKFDQEFKHAHTIYVEAVAAGKVLMHWIRHEQDRLCEKLPIQEVKKQTKANALKEKVRIRRLSPRVEAGKLRLWKQAPGIAYLLEEMRQWPIGKDEHLLDALATMAELAPRGRAPEGETRPEQMKPGSVGWWMNEIESKEREDRERIGAWRDRPRWAIQRRPYR